VLPVPTPSWWKATHQQPAARPPLRAVRAWNAGRVDSSSGRTCYVDAMPPTCYEAPPSTIDQEMPIVVAALVLPVRPPALSVPTPLVPWYPLLP
jgi:hypothetical protein